MSGNSYFFIYISVQFSPSVVFDSLKPHEPQHTRLPCPSPIPRAYSNSCPSSWWCHPTISSSVIPFSFCLQLCTTSGSFSMSQFFESGGWCLGVSASASVLPMNTQDWFPLGLNGLISLQSKGPSRVFSNTTGGEGDNRGWDGHGFGWIPGVGDRQRGLVCCGSWGRKELDVTEWLNWTEFK